MNIFLYMNKQNILLKIFLEQNLLVLGLCRKEKSSGALASLFSAFDPAGSSGLVSYSGSERFNVTKFWLVFG